MRITNWTETALRARLRADRALHVSSRPVTSELAAQRLEYVRIVSAVDRGRVSADEGAAAFEALTSATAAVPCEAVAA